MGRIERNGEEIDHWEVSGMAEDAGGLLGLREAKDWAGMRSWGQLWARYWDWRAHWLTEAK